MQTFTRYIHVCTYTYLHMYSRTHVGNVQTTTLQQFPLSFWNSLLCIAVCMYVHHIWACDLKKQSLQKFYQIRHRGSTFLICTSPYYTYILGGAAVWAVLNGLVWVCNLYPPIPCTNNLWECCHHQPLVCQIDLDVYKQSSRGAETSRLCVLISGCPD